MIAPDLQTRLTKWTLNWLLLSERLPNISCCSVVAYLDLLLVFLICMSRGFSWAKKRLVEMTLSGDGLLFLAAQQWRRSNNNLLKRKESGKKIKAERPACFLFNLWAVTTYFSVKTFISLVSPSRVFLRNFSPFCKTDLPNLLLQSDTVDENNQKRLIPIFNRNK